MEKNNRLIIISLVAILFAVMFGFSEYGRIEMRRQIDERDRCIASLDSMVKTYLGAEQKENYYVFNIPVDQYGNKLSIKELDSIRIANERIIWEQDAILCAAKKIYEFNYSSKMKGDSLVIKLWDKKQRTR